jgi:hypothetical protein
MVDLSSSLCDSLPEEDLPNSLTLNSYVTRHETDEPEGAKNHSQLISWIAHICFDDLAVPITLRSSENMEIPW